MSSCVNIFNSKDKRSKTTRGFYWAIQNYFTGGFIKSFNKKSYFLSFCVLFTLSTFAQNKTYYISTSGNDDNDGLSVFTPWKTISKISSYHFYDGDKVLLRGGDKFIGNLEIQPEDGALSVASYGSGKAKIHADTGDGIYVHNRGRIVIRNVAVEGNGAEKDSSSGISFYMTTAGDLSNIVIDSTEVYGFGGFGILLGAWKTTSGYNNVRITNNVVHDNGQAGIFTYGYKDLYNHNNFYIGYNKAYNNRGRTDITYTNTGSGIIISGVDGFTMEYCEAYNNGANNRNKGGGPVGLWCYNAKNGIIQYCESHHNKAGLQADGGGFDIDGGSQNCVLQYNYSHDNEGAGLAFFEYGSSNQFVNDTIRYNISENDGLKNGYGGLAFWANDSKNKITNSTVYNNVIYANNPLSGCAIHIINTNFSNVSVFNNIFYCKGVPMLTGDAGKITWKNNDYFSTTTANFTTGGTTVNPGLISPGTGIKGYRLLPNSAMINAGLPHNTGKDFYGNPVPNKGEPDIGVYESPETLVGAVIASSDDGNIPFNTIDDDLNTRWSARGNNQWIRFQLDTTTFIKTVNIAWNRGNERNAFFDIQTSLNGNDWTNVFSGKSTGETVSLESYNVKPQYGNYVRIVGHGNSLNDWNAITEFEIAKSSDSSRLSNPGLVSPVINDAITKPTLQPVLQRTETGQFYSWPNPSAGIVNVKTSYSWLGAEITVYDLSGKIVLQKKLNQLNVQLNLLNQSKGIYGIKLFKDGKVVNSKIILQ